VSRFSAIVPLAVIAILLAGCATGAGGRASSRASGAASAAAGSGSGSATLVGHPTVVAIGDSIMKGWRLDNLACDGAGFLAVGNDSDCGEAFAGLVAKAVALHPRTVIIEGSSNDFGESNDALMPETVAQLAQLRAALPDAQIIGLSTIWGDTSVPAQLTDIDEQMRVAVTRVGGQFLQIGQPLGGHPEWMQSDDVHPTADGQLAIYASVQAAFAVSHLHG
jgi:acyl-CoA thioesterase-1